MKELYVIFPKRPWMKAIKLSGVLRGEKMAWFVISGEKRFLVGSTAFFTEASANVARYGRCSKIAQSKYLRRCCPGLVYKAKMALAEIKS